MSRPCDVDQGHLGDCILLAPLAAIARVKPTAIRRLITSSGDGTYDVSESVEQPLRPVPGGHGGLHAFPMSAR